MMNTLLLPGIEPQVLLHPASSNVFSRMDKLSWLRHLKSTLRSFSCIPPHVVMTKLVI